MSLPQRRSVAVSSSPGGRMKGMMSVSMNSDYSIKSVILINLKNGLFQFHFAEAGFLPSVRFIERQGRAAGDQFNLSTAH
jgi:hypothetical protein